MKENQFNGVSQVSFNNEFENFLNLDDSSKLTRQVYLEKKIIFIERNSTKKKKTNGEKPKQFWSKKLIY